MPQPDRRSVLTALAGLAAGWAGAGAASAMETVVGSRPLGPHPAPPPAAGTQVLILPFQGLPTNTADSIYRRIRTVAPKRALKLVLRLDEPASYRVAGTFSAVGGIGSSIVVYRIRIHDPAGRILHEFAGQEIAPASSGDPWANLDRATIEHLGDAIADGLEAWLTRSGG